MKTIQRQISIRLWMGVLLALAACQSGGPPATPRVTELAMATATLGPAEPGTHVPTENAPTPLVADTVAPAATATIGQVTAQFDIPQAKSVNVVAGPGEAVYVLAGQGSDLWLYRSGDGGESFDEGAVVSQGTHAEVLAVVVPALAVGVDGRLAVAWVEFGDGGVARVRAAISEDGGATYGQAAVIAETTDPETTMASVVFAAAQQPLVTWLQNNSVRASTAVSEVDEFSDPVVVDDLVCECCQPAPLIVGERLFVAYRNLVRDSSGQAYRDIYLTASADGGATFAEPVPVSDGTWPIDACPIAGPALVERQGTLYAAWMDGRFDDGTFSRTDIWLAISTDGGLTFGPNTRVNAAEGHYNGQPAMAIDSQGQIHVAWVSDTAEGPSLQYAVSADGGQTFPSVEAVVTGTGRLGSVTLAVSNAGQVVLAWTDARGAHVRPLE